jgi:Putative auto-transporter adhesin, head GIN domain
MRLPSVLVASMLLGCGGPQTLVFGNGVLSTVERAVPGTTSVSVSTWGDLTIRLGSPASLSITGEENLLPHLTSEVQAGKLWLGTEPFVSLRPTRGMTYVLTVPSLTAITTSSSGSVTAPALSVPDFTVTTSSSGSITVDGLEANTLTTRISSSGNVSVSGAVRDHSISISSNGDVLADGLRSTNATVNVSSSGNALLWVTERLDVTISSSGNVRYYGDPHVKAQLSSSGKVIPMGNR